MDRKRGLWLIDAGYLFSCQRSVEPGYEFDYKKLREKVEAEGPLWRAYYLNSTPNPPSDAQNGFHSWLRSAPPTGPKIITKLYELKRIAVDHAYCQSCNAVTTAVCEHSSTGGPHRMHKEQQKGVDVGIATLGLTLINEYDTLILSSGDGDLLDAVEYLSQHGKQLELLVFKAGVSTDLQARADRIYWIDDFKDDVRR
jgi:uncharacterized LabA/DUF88 family protein